MSTPDRPPHLVLQLAGEAVLAAQVLLAVGCRPTNR